MKIITKSDTPLAPELKFDVSKAAGFTWTRLDEFYQVDGW
jgi:hypothetical protein